MDGRPNRRNKAAFSNFSKVAGTLPKIYKVLAESLQCQFNHIVLFGPLS